MNLRRAMIGALLALAIALPLAIGSDQALAERFAQVQKIYVKSIDSGSIDAVSGARTALTESGCFQVADDPDAADAVLEIASDRQGNWLRLPFGGLRISASAALLDRKTGKALWTDDRSSRWLLSSALAGRAVVNALIRDHGCETEDSEWEPFQSLKTAKSVPAGNADQQAASEGSDSAAAPKQGSAALAAAPGAAAKVINRGMTPAQVEAVLGPPLTRANLGDKVLYKYKDVTVEFRNGKVTDVR